MEVRLLLSHGDRDVGTQSSLVITFQRGSSQVLEEERWMVHLEEV